MKCYLNAAQVFGNLLVEVIYTLATVLSSIMFHRNHMNITCNYILSLTSVGILFFGLGSVCFQQGGIYSLLGPATCFYIELGYFILSTKVKTPERFF